MRPFFLSSNSHFKSSFHFWTVVLQIWLWKKSKNVCCGKCSRNNQWTDPVKDSFQRPCRGYESTPGWTIGSFLSVGFDVSIFCLGYFSTNIECGWIEECQPWTLKSIQCSTYCKRYQCMNHNLFFSIYRFVAISKPLMTSLLA